MKVSGQLHFPATLPPGKELLIPNGLRNKEVQVSIDLLLI
jgi:hypothetical protein